jgi:O-antigen/teichoic acid export membrane protein
VAQVSYYGIAVPLAVSNWGAWALATGWVLEQAVACVLYHLAAHYFPRPTWDRAALWKMLSYSFTYSISQWVWQARSLVNPIIVGGLLGVEAVGFVNIATRLVELLAFVNDAIWHVSISAFSRFQTDHRKLLAAIGEGMQLEMFAVGFPLVMFAGVGNEIIDVILGPRWLPAFDVYPFIAFAYLTNCLFALHSTALNVLQRNWDVAMSAGVNLLVLSLGTYLLIPVFGLRGYGLADIAALTAFLILHFRVRHSIGAVPYGIALWWYFALALALLLRPVGAWICIVPFALLAWPASWRRLLSYLRLLTTGSGALDDPIVRELSGSRREGPTG